jgi:hypothetical protein
MGVIYKAEDARLHGFARETESASALNPPDICNTFELGRHLIFRIFVLSVFLAASSRTGAQTAGGLSVAFRSPRSRD